MSKQEQIAELLINLDADDMNRFIGYVAQSVLTTPGEPLCEMAAKFIELVEKRKAA